jgi:hypothetical protein
MKIFEQEDAEKRGMEGLRAGLPRFDSPHWLVLMES